MSATVLLLLVSSGCRGAPDVQTVNVTIHYSRFQPAHFGFEPGATVRFVVRNTDPIDHEFILGDRAVQREHETGVQATHDGSVPGQISVPAGQVAATTYTFSRAGPLLFGCHLPGHYAFGMRGTLDVG